MVPWRLYQEFAREMGVSSETMHLINILADTGYLIQDTPPFLNLEIPDAFGTRKTWLKEHPTKGIEFCKDHYGTDAAVAATLRCVGAEVVDYTEGDTETSFSLLGSHIGSFLDDIKTRSIETEVERVRGRFDTNTEDNSVLDYLSSRDDSDQLRLKRIEKAHNAEEVPYRYCDSCGERLMQSFPYRCDSCDARFPGWLAQLYREAEEQGKSR